MAPSPSVGPRFEPERAADDDRLLPDHEVQEVEERRVRPRPVGVPGLAELWNTRGEAT